MTRQSRGPVRQVILRIPELQFAEMLAFNPQMIDPLGQTRYGALQNYFLGLMMQDVERKRLSLREASPRAGEIPKENIDAAS